MALRVAWLCGGKLHVIGEDGACAEVESAFARAAAQAAQDIARNREWKARGPAGLPFAGMEQPGAADPLRSLSNIVSATRGTRPGEFAHVLQTDRVGGLFLRQEDPQGERRLFHRESFRATDLDRNPDSFDLLCAHANSDGTSCIMLIDEEGLKHRALTEGDTVDGAPSWVPGSSTRFLYHSAGIARNAQGLPTSLGPAHIIEMDAERGTLTTLAEGPDHDYLMPHRAANGDLYFIRRPWNAAARPSPLRFALDVVMVPFRLVSAVFGFLNVFSMIFNQKPLMTSAGKKLKPEEQVFLSLRGHAIDATKAMRARPGDEEGAIAPATWELVRRPAAGAEEVVARGVCSYDLQDGVLVYTNGRAIYARWPDGRKKTLLRGKLVEEVAILEAE